MVISLSIYVCLAVFCCEYEAVYTFFKLCGYNPITFTVISLFIHACYKSTYNSILIGLPQNKDHVVTALKNMVIRLRYVVMQTFLIRSLEYHTNIALIHRLMIILSFKTTFFKKDFRLHFLSQSECMKLGHCMALVSSHLITPFIDDWHVDVVYKHSHLLSCGRSICGTHSLVHIALNSPLEHYTTLNFPSLIAETFNL